MSTLGGDDSGTPLGRSRQGADILAIAARILVVLICLAALVGMIQGFAATTVPAHDTPTATALSPDDPAASPTPEGSAAISTAMPSTPRIGIVAGHAGSDPGAVCNDGLSEAEVNLDVAERVVNLLGALGHNVDLLDEFDPRLQGYEAAALVSVHADSCEPFAGSAPDPSGFKVASVANSVVPEAEQRLVACLVERYGARTGLYHHVDSVTRDMTYYHTFFEIEGQTPAAVIETGFLLADREMLTTQAHLVARGIADGIVCFLED
ncbi:MAG: hypothetical protein E3J64_08980 [Anaerolineales bacterium]|nr:MAG: hypothetical protein E3J64_08980 [Anaerolineales bacterium]